MRNLATAFSLLALVVGRAVVLAQPGAYKLAPGPYELGVVSTLTLHDDARDKDLLIRVTYPKSDGVFPVLVFCHGMFGSKDGNQPLIEHWASHGYLCLQATHQDSLSLVPRGKRLKTLRDVKLKQMIQLPGWQERAKDVSFLLDSLDEVERIVPELKGKLDVQRIGVGGHSFGAHTSQVLWGAELFDAAGKPIDLRDDRPRAFLLLSPQGRGPDGLTNDSWLHCTRPMMTLSGSNDNGRNGQPATWRRDPFNLCPAGDKYLLWMEGAHHNLGGISGNPAADRLLRIGSPNETQVNLVKMAGLAFWDAYVKDDPAALAYLQSKGLTQYGHGAATLERR